MTSQSSDRRSPVVIQTDWETARRFHAIAVERGLLSGELLALLVRDYDAHERAYQQSQTEAPDVHGAV